MVGALQSGGFEGPATKLPPPLIYLDKMLYLGGFDLHNTRDAFGSFANKVKKYFNLDEMKHTVDINFMV